MDVDLDGISMPAAATSVREHGGGMRGATVVMREGYTGVQEFGRRRRGVGIGASTPAAAIRPAASCAHATSPLTSIPCGGRSA